MLAAATVGWDGLNENGKPIEFSEQAAIELYTRYPLIKIQIDNALSDDTNFLQNAASD